MTPFARLLIAIVFAALGVPLYLRLVPPNSLYGVRAAATGSMTPFGTKRIIVPGVRIPTSVRF